MKIVFDANFPVLIKPKVSEILTEFKWLLPDWVQRLTVRYDGADEESSCFIHAEKDYRFGSLTVCGHWAEEKPDVQIEQIIHELIHFHYTPLTDYARATIEELCGDNETMFKIIDKELEGKNEQATQDLAWAIFRRFKL